MADGKWISGLKADMPLAEAASLAFAARAKAIRKNLPLAVSHAGDNVEYIHQLRVGTRRAGAVVSEFEDCWSDKFRGKLKKRLKRLRHAAGAARDWDVMRMALQGRRENVDEVEWAGIDYLLGFAQGEREAAQRQLEIVARELGTEELEELWDLAEAAARNPRGDSKPKVLSDLAKVRMAEHFRLLDEAASGDLNDFTHLHQVRIRGKQMRYAMELFVECFTPRFKKELYPTIEEMQEILGTANDSHVASERLGSLSAILKKTDKAEWSRVQPGFDALLAFHDNRLKTEQAAFISWWQNWQRLPSAFRL